MTQVSDMTECDDNLKLNSVYRLVSENTCDGYIYRNYKDDTYVISNRVKLLLGLDDDKLDGISDAEDIFDGVVDYDDIVAYASRLGIAKEAHENYFEYSLHCDSINRWLNLNVYLFYGNDSICDEMIVYFTDVTNQVEAKGDLEYQAYYDTMTGLYNRAYFYNILEGWIKLASDREQKIYIMYLDVDDFKKVNDELGFESGDELMIKVSHFLKKFTTPNISICRVSSDEFILAQYGGSIEDIKDKYYCIRNFLDNSIKLDNGIIEYLTISAGISVYPEHGKRIVDLIGNADIALKTVKTNGKNNIRLFEHNMLSRFLRDIRIENMLKKAIQNENFELYYQPQYYVNNRKIRGLEALIRWNSESEGYIAPGAFIPLAEKNGSIIEIGNWVLKKAIMDYGMLRSIYGFDGIMSINISGIQFKDSLFEKNVEALFEQHRIDPSKIEFEITESVFMGDSKSVIELLERLRTLGIKISIDDFGTGYSSLAYLKNIPIDTLKIDKSFIDSVITEETTSIITTGIIDIVKKLGYEIIAEGVETAEQFDFLKSINCDNIQGYLLGHPMRYDDVCELLKGNSKF
ncbi:MAG TPA: hypothetical protein DEO82_04865 [Eubacterium sp.]|nr:hypothetical protein [Eubacterium sp.]